MESQHRILKIICVLIILGLLSCQGTSIPQNSLTVLSPSIPTRTVSPTEPVRSPTQTATPFPTRTIEPSSTSTSTSTLTATSTLPPPVRFAVIGDYGLAGENEQAVAEMVLSWKPDFILTAGDNNYPNGAADTIDENIGQYYHSYIFPYAGKYGLGAERNRFFPAMGNHDWNTASGQAYLDYFNLPGNERYYDFTWGPVHIFVLDSDWREPDGVGKSSAQAAWLKKSLADSLLSWKIVIMHHPPYSSGYHGATDWMRWPFAEWGADAVLSGHDHTYERLEVEGGLYFVNGLGGASRYVFLFQQAGSLARFNQTYGAMLVEAMPEEINFSFFAVPGEIIDSYTLTALR